jgi:hypothetical protein
MWAEIFDFGLAKVIRDPARCREERGREERCRSQELQNGNEVTMRPLGRHRNGAIIDSVSLALPRVSMNQAPGVLIANQRVERFRPAPRLRLLVELEPRHRVFFRNLFDLLLSQPAPRIPVTSLPARFWSDVFVPSGAPWSSFLESILLHLLLIAFFVWGQSRILVSVKLFTQPGVFHRSITYYPPTPSFPAAEGRASARVRPRVKLASPSRPAMPVTPERKPAIVTPPDLKQATARLPDLPGSHTVTPMVPFSAAAGPRRNALPGQYGVVAPPPQVDQQVDQATARRLALPQAAAVAPAPDFGGPSTERAMKAPNTGGLGVVPPPPSVLNPANSARAGRLSSGLNSGEMNSGAGPNVVPPPPSVQGGGNAAGGGRFSAMAAGSQVVPPPPSVQGAGLQGAGNSARTGRILGDGLSLKGSQAVPPPPSVQGAGNSTGSGRILGDRLTGSQVVPPPPSMQGSGGPAAGTRWGSLSGAGSEVVPPPPSVENAGNSGAGGRLGPLSGGGSQIASALPSAEGAGYSGAGRSLEPMDPLPSDDSTSAEAANNESKSTVDVLPLGLIGVVFAAPGTSFFSNFEVFVAKRRVANDQMQLIKLVYEFLPYQRRLSEYDLSNLPPRVIKLRVKPDPSCDESLGQMIQSHTDPGTSVTEYPKLPEALRSQNLNALLHCYRITADDFQKAMSGAR